MTETHLSEKDIQLASFFVRIKPVLKKIGIVSALLIDATFIFVGIWYWGQYYIFARPNHENSASTFINQSAPAAQDIKVRYTAKPLNVIATKSIERVDGTNDYVAIVENPNNEWLSNIEYSFSTGLGPTESNMSSVLPGEKRVIGVYGSEKNGTSASIQLQNVEWIRIDRHKVGDPKQFMSDRVQFAISEPSYINAGAEAPVDRILFSITNQSAYSYFEVDLSAAIYFDGGLIGIEQLSVAPLKSGETKFIEIHSPARGIIPSEVEILPHVDIFDESVYIKIGS